MDSRLAPPTTPTPVPAEALRLLRQYGNLQRRLGRLALLSQRTRQSLATTALLLESQYVAAGNHLPWVTPLGTIGHRRSRAAVRVVPGHHEAEALRRLSLLAPKYLRVQRHLARERILADRHRPELQSVLPLAGLCIAYERSIYISVPLPTDEIPHSNKSTPSNASDNSARISGLPIS